MGNLSLALETSVVDPKQKFRIRIRSEASFGSNPRVESESESRSGSRSDTGKNCFFCTKFLPNLIFKHKKAAFPQLRDFAMNKVRNNFAGFWSGSIGKRHGSVDPSLYQNVTDQQRWIQLLENIKYCMYNRMKLPYFVPKLRLLFTDFVWIRNISIGSGSSQKFWIRIRNTVRNSWQIAKCPTAWNIPELAVHSYWMRGRDFSKNLRTSLFNKGLSKLT